MKLFLDTANVDAIKTLLPIGLIDGVTINPALLSMVSGDPRKAIENICALLPQGLISVQVTEQDPERMYKQAHAIAQIAPHIIVKVPCLLVYYPIIQQLIQDHIRLNITLVFSVAQAAAMARLKATMVSPFVGRLEEAHEDAIQLIRDMRTVFNHHGFTGMTQILAASIRTPFHLSQALVAGADIVTVSPEVLVLTLNPELSVVGEQHLLEKWKKKHTNSFP